MELFETTEIRQVLMDLAKDIEENYKDQLVKSGRYTTEYALLDSVKTEVKVNGQSYEVIMTLNDYWKYVENDTKPHFPPPSKILDWIQIKPIFPRPLASGKIPRPEQLAYLIGRKISKVGTKGSHDLERTKDAVIPVYRAELEKALGHDVENYITKLVRE